MKSRRDNLWSRAPVALALFVLFCGAAWAGESPDSADATADKVDRSGLFSRFVKGVKRPFGCHGWWCPGGQPGRTSPEPAVEVAAADPAPAPASVPRQPASVPRQPASVPRQPASVPRQYVLGPHDLLAINVWREPQVSRDVPVRPDGKISIPLAGEIQAAGLTPLELEAKITEALQPYIATPEVTVIVEKVNPPKFNILGEVQRPGSYEMAGGMSVLDALAVAGGFREFAKVKEIYVLRRVADGSPERLLFNYKQVKRGRNFDQNVELKPGDTIVIP